LTHSTQRKLRYEPVLDDDPEIPAWIDSVLRQAVHPNLLARYETLSEFVYDLRQPNRAFLSKTRPPLIERHPLAFWKGTSAILGAFIVVLLFIQFGRSWHLPRLNSRCAAASSCH
jgi:hypothetical protein